MKAQIGLLFLFVITMALADTVTYPRGCIYINGRCEYSFILYYTFVFVFIIIFELLNGLNRFIKVRYISFR